MSNSWQTADVCQACLARDLCWVFDQERSYSYYRAVLTVSLTNECERLPDPCSEWGFYNYNRRLCPRRLSITPAVLLTARPFCVNVGLALHTATLLRLSRLTNALCKL